MSPQLNLPFGKKIREIEMMSPSNCDGKTRSSSPEELFPGMEITRLVQFEHRIPGVNDLHARTINFASLASCKSGIWSCRSISNKP